MSTFGAYDRLIAQKEREIDALIAQRDLLSEIEARFGEDDYPDGAVLTWTRRFEPGGLLYTYAAVKVGMLWFTTGKYQTGRTWNVMVQQHLSVAEQVWWATEWTEV